MPRVPVLQPQQRLSPLPGPTISSAATPALMGGIAAKQAENLGDDLLRGGVILQRMQVDEQERVNDVRVTDAVNKGMAAKLRLTHDPQQGFTNLRGESALNRPEGKSLQEEYQTRLQGDFDKISEGLGNPLQKQRFQQQSQQIMAQFDGAIQQHVSRAFTEHKADVLDTTVKIGQQQMGLEYANPPLVAQASNAIRDSVYKTGKELNWSDDRIRVTTMEALSPGHLAVIKSATDAGQMEYARTYAEGIQHELTPDAVYTSKKTLEAGDIETQAQESSETILRKTKGDFGAALKLARETLSGKKEDAVVARIKVQQAERQAAKEQYQSNNADAAWRELVANNYDISKVSPSLKAGMDGRDLASMHRTAQAEMEGGVKTDPNTYYELSRLSLTDPEKFVGTDMRRYFDKLGPTDRKKFIDMQAEMSKTGYDQVVTLQAQVETMVKSLGLKNEEAGQFNMVADKALHAAQQQKGTALTQSERQSVLDGLVIRGKTGDEWWGTTPRYKAMIDEKPFNTPEWSDADIRKARASLARMGNNNPTDEQISSVLHLHYSIPR